MQLVNGAGTTSYRKCINQQCETLPTNVLKGHHRKGYAIQILYCDEHFPDAQGVALQDFAGIFFEGIRSPSWLKKAQESELRTMQEAQTSSKKVEG